MIPLLLKPSLLALKNRWKSSIKRKDRWARDLALISVTVFFILLSYTGGLAFLNSLAEQKAFLFPDPKIIINLALFFLILLLLVSNLVQALSSLYTGKDLDFILSSPITSKRFFIGKYFEILFSTSWMAFIFVLPFLLVLKTFYNLSSIFYIEAFLLLSPLFLIPCSLSICIASIYPLILPKKYSKEVLIVIAIGLFSALIKMLNLVAREIQNVSNNGLNEVADLASVLTFSDKIWLPSYWISSSIAYRINGELGQFYYLVALSVLLAVFLTSLSYLLVKYLHLISFSLITGTSSTKIIESSKFQAKVENYFRMIKRPIRGIIVKDFKLFVRDITQASQAGILLGLSSTYVYILNSQKIFQSTLNVADKNWWSAFLSSSNIGLEAFILVAVSTRLVFPSISLEGGSFWLLHSSPLVIKDILKAKLNSWLVPICLIFGILFTLATLAIHGSLIAAAIKLITTIIICYGIISLAIGLGAFFCNFNWDHSSELAAGLGSLIFMLSAFTLIIFDVGITTIILNSYNGNIIIPRSDAELFNSPWTYLGILMLIIFNVLVNKLALRIGEKSMIRENS